MNQTRRYFRLAVAFLLALPSVGSPVASFATSVNVGQQTRIEVPVRSYKDLRDRAVVKQTLDYSCGAAALATLLTFGLGDSVKERDILVEIMSMLSKDEESVRKKEGISLLDMQHFAQGRDHRAQGFRLGPEVLPKLEGPVIVFIRPQGYEHFAVLRGFEGDRVFLADPSLGNVRMPVYRFLRMWLDPSGKGIIFIVERTDGQMRPDSPLNLQRDNHSATEVLSVRQLLEVRPVLQRTVSGISLGRR